MLNPPPLIGLVLAGGQSRRMGFDKAAIELQGQNLLARAVALLAGELDEVRIAVRPDQVSDVLRSRHSIIEDRFKDIGPAAGILSAHLSDPGSAWLVIACDMPMLNAETIRLLAASRDIHADATAWASADANGAEPLCTIYEPGTLAAFLAAVKSGKNPSPRAWLAAAQLRLLNAPAPGVLASANTPAELQRIIDSMAVRSGASRQDDV